MKRYECDCYAGTVWMEEKALGDYVKYEDHIAVVQKLEERVRELEEALDNAQRRMRAEGVRQYGMPG